MASGRKLFNQRLCFISLTFFIAVGGMAIFIFTAVAKSSQEDMTLYKRAVNFFTDKVQRIEKAISSGTHSKLERTERSEKQDADEFPYKNIRLPDNIKPDFYKITMHPQLKGNFDFKGNIIIHFEVVKATKYVIFHSKKLNIKSKALSEGKNKVTIKRMLFKESYDLVLLETEEELAKGGKYKLKLKFTGELSNKMAGFYKSSYKTKNGEVRYLATTQFESTDARAAFPCFDEPEFKAKFQINMIHKSDMRAISNMPAIREKKLGKRNVKTMFNTTVPMSTYLVAFVVSDFNFTETYTDGNIKIRVWAQKELLNSTHLALDVAKKVLTYYEEFFNIDYPLPKLDLIAVPDFAAGAMENWGLMTFRETYLLSNEASASASDKQSVAIVVAHELAHQWFGNLVTMKWWQDLWLNEGFANYVEYMGTDHYAPDWKVLDQFVPDTFQSALQVDSMSNTHPISQPVDNPSQIMEMFDTISYNKGSSLIRMLRSFMGDKAFQKGLECYLKKHAYGNAEANDLWAALEKQTPGLNVTNIMNTWITQKGYPVVTISENTASKRDGIPGNRKAGQMRFFRDLNPSMADYQDSAKGVSWYVPLTYVTSDDPHNSITAWMNKTSAYLNNSGDAKWIKANYNQKGYYRVNYDEANWNSLIKQLNTDHMVFHQTDRSGLIDDAFACARAGLLKLSKALETTSYLHNERDYIPWATALSQFSFIGSMLTFTPSHDHYNEYIVEKIKPIVDYVGLHNTGSILQKKLRSSVLSIYASHGDPDLVDFSLKEFHKWMKNPSDTISPHLRDMVYRTAIKFGGPKEWRFLWRKYENSNDQTEKIRMMWALTGSRDPSHLATLLIWTLDSKKIRTQDMTSVLAQVASNPIGKYLAWDHFRGNFEKIVNRTGKDPMEIGYMIMSTSRFNKQFYLKEFKDFVKEHNETLGELLSVKKAIEGIESNIRWMTAHYNDVTEWLTKKTEQREHKVSTRHATHRRHLQKRNLGNDFPMNGNFINFHGLVHPMDGIAERQSH